MAKQKKFGPGKVPTSGGKSNDMNNRINPQTQSGTSGAATKPTSGFPQSKTGTSKATRHMPSKR